jgi:murein L,D-transpeptidase YcbB/YkuD
LFDRDERAFSHGCVRVQNPRDFAAVVLGWTPEEVNAHVGTPKTETITLKTKLPVHVTYFTAWPGADGRIQYFKDIYGRDATMQKARSAVMVAQR